MLKRSKPTSQAGFTLVEVALAVAVGLIILGGAVMGYNAVKDNASSSEARRRVNFANGLLQEYAAANSGFYPTSVAAEPGGSFTAMWRSKFPDEFSRSPWGGPTGDTTDGVNEEAPISDGTADPAAAPDKSAILTQNGSRAANLIYVSIANNHWAKVQQFSNPNAILARGYALSIYDRTGQPWFHLATGK